MFGLKNGNFCEWQYDVDKEPLLATLFTTGNGYMGVRGSFEEFGSLRVQGAFVRGYIDEIIEVCEPFANNEYMKKFYLNEEKLKGFETQDTCVNMHDFLFVRVIIGGECFYPWEGKILSWDRTLDASTAVYTRRVVWEDSKGRQTELCFERFASFANRHLYCQRVTVKPINHEEEVEIISGVDTLRKTGGQFITKTDKAEIIGADISHVFHATNKYGFGAEYYVKNAFPKGSLSTYEENGVIGVCCKAEKASEYVLEKISVIAIDRDSELALADYVKAQVEKTVYCYETQLKVHEEAYKTYFAPMDVQIEGDDDADGYLRFASYHSAISACMEDSVHGISAKGLTGERYNQFVWWDCEIHQMPFFLSTAPETAKNLLMYRYRMLEQSKKNAIADGKKGAKYAFCSSVTGEEMVWQYARHPFMQVHINSDIPMGVLSYYAWTGDVEFMHSYGFELMHECLRYWTSRVTKRNGRYEILQVTGTDEHHPYVDNDAYTNYCVQHIFEEFLRLAKVLNYPLSAEEEAEFADIAANTYLPMTESGLIPQFDGYFSLSRTLEEAGGGSLKQFQMKKSGLYHKSQIIKQPDVALLYTLADVGLEGKGYSLNWDYYEQMCETSSSLTFPVHAIASADNGRMLSFYNYFIKTLKIDVDDIHGVGWQGVHSGCLAGGYLSVLRGVFGVRATDNGVVIKPNPMPTDMWKKVTAKFIYRDSLVEISARGREYTLKLLQGTPCKINFCGEEILLSDCVEKTMGV
ncbi:MAG: glycoside hydrolase family 65 protein [Clostridia bacterium]|nr:glycoside hydrolase family 65 protein [Clostridia bacterium]